MESIGKWYSELGYLCALFVLPVSIFLLLPAQSIAMSHEHGEENHELHLEHHFGGHGGHHDSKQGSLFDKLEQHKDEFELARINQTFSNIDALFADTVIKYQTINSHKELGRESITNLAWLLSEPHDKTAIIKIIEKGISRSLQPSELSLLDGEESLSLPTAVRLLWKEGIIGDKKARSILLQNNPLSSQELIRLVENGVVQTEKGYYVQLRTGSNYGDPLKLFNDIDEIVKKVKNHDYELKDVPLRELWHLPIRPEIAEEFTRAGLPPDQMITDAHIIREMRRHFLFVSSLGIPIRFRPGRVDFQPNEGGGASPPNPNNFVDLIVSPRTLSATLVGNYYISNLNASTTHALFVNPLGITYAGSFNTVGHGVDWWLNYSEGFLGGGANYTVNFDQGTSWSNGQPTYLAVGGMVGGWRNNLSAGMSVSTVLANGIGIGASAHMSITRSHDVTYLGEYPSDGKFSRIRGMHKIEIDDTVGVAASASVAANFSAVDVPVSVAFRAGASHTTRRIYRTHGNLEKTQRMLTESEIPGVLFLLGKKIRETRIPKFEKPEILIDGDELVETKIGTLSGAFVIGLETMIPIHAARVGGSVELTAEFELGLRKLPNDKYEVSIEPKRIYEFGLFTSLLNIFTAGYVKSMAVARKQIFIFDFTEPEARRAYFDLIDHGRLPTSEEIEIHSEDRGPEYLLTEFRAQNEELQLRGIARTYLEKVQIMTSKKHIGVQAPLIPAVLDIANYIDTKARKSKERWNLQFEGLDRELVRSHAVSVATNGLISVTRQTFGGRKSEGQGFSGRYNQDLFVTHRRIHSIDEAPTEFAGNKWQFDSLSVHAQLEDTILTGNEENEMAQKVNQLFSAFIGSFEYKNSRAPRVITIEREFTKRDLDQLTKTECRNRVATASQTTGIDQSRILMLLKKLKNKHPDHQGLIVKKFIETNSGLTGFAALHQILGAKPEHLFIRTDSGYNQAVLDAKQFIATYTNAESTDDKPSINLVPVSEREHKKHIRDFYDEARFHLREIDTQLRRLNDDKYLLDKNSSLVRIYDEQKIDELIKAGVRQDKTSFRSALVTARKTILELLDLKLQGFSPEERWVIYKMAGSKRIRLKEHLEILLNRYEDHPLRVGMPGRYLRERLSHTWDAIARLDKRIKMLEEDEEMKLMDDEYVQTLLLEFNELRDRLRSTINYSHLERSDRQQINKNMEPKKRFPFGRKSKNIRVDGALAQTYLSESDDGQDARTSEPNSLTHSALSSSAELYTDETTWTE